MSLSSNRIQKLLFTEYSELDDVVLLESPFAQTTRDGEGIQQVQMGLTETKLILAKDFNYLPKSPHIRDSTLELISVLPVEYVNLSVFSRKTRKTIKASFCNQQILYFELATSSRRQMFWTLWCEKIKFLGHDSTKSSQSSAYSSSIALNDFDGGTSAVWTNKHLYLGPALSQSSNFKKEKNKEIENYHSVQDDMKFNNSIITLVHRFGAGVAENCTRGLFLPVEVKVKPDTGHILPVLTDEEKEEQRNFKYLLLGEEAVRVWERNHSGIKHRRQCAVIPRGNHFFGIEKTFISKEQAVSLQVKKCSSEVLVRPSEFDGESDVPKRLLVSSMSSHNLVDKSCYDCDQQPNRPGSTYKYQRRQLNFWVPRDSKPKPYLSAFKTLRNRLNTLRLFHEVGYGRIISLEKIKSKGKLSTSRSEYSGSKKRLKMDITLSSWDFDSTVIAYQLTIIERDFFVKLDESELASVLFERNSTNAPNMANILTFSNRLMNLVASEIVRVDSVKMRARLIAKYINVADKLHRLHNMQSAHNVIRALQSPAVYRMRKTWDCVRKHHQSKYHRLLTLMKIYREVRGELFCRVFIKFCQTTPYLPSISYVLSHLFGQTVRPIGGKLDEKWCSHSKSELGKKYTRYSNWGNSSQASVSSETTCLSAITVDSGDVISQLCKPLISYSPLRQLAISSALLDSWHQAATDYAFTESPLVLEFLLKAKYMDEYECFDFSKKMEPRPHWYTLIHP